MNAWIDEHIETFIKPHLGKIPNFVIEEKHHLKYYVDPKFLDFLLAAWEEAKRKSKGRKILLAGRDVWMFEVLSKMEDNPFTVFDPRISGKVAKALVIPKAQYEGYYLIDTGYKGTVPISLGIEHWHLLSYYPSAVCKDPSEKRSLFPLRHPHNQMASGAAGNIECSPKYWEPGEVCKDTNKITQIVNRVEVDFLRAALLTKLIAGHAKKSGFISRLKAKVMGS